MNEEAHGGRASKCARHDLWRGIRSDAGTNENFTYIAAEEWLAAEEILHVAVLGDARRPVVRHHNVEWGGELVQLEHVDLARVVDGADRAIVVGGQFVMAAREIVRLEDAGKAANAHAAKGDDAARAEIVDVGGDPAAVQTVQEDQW